MVVEEQIDGVIQDEEDRCREYNNVLMSQMIDGIEKWS